MKKLAAFLVCLVVLSGAALAQQQRDWAKVEVKSEPVRGNIHMLSTNEGGNIGVSVGPVELLSLSSGQVTNALLTRSPLGFSTNTKSPFDLHVLSTPPGFILSQDQLSAKTFVSFDTLRSRI